SSSSATSNSSQNNSFGVTTPNIDPSIAFCLIPGHCYSSFTATATITSNALSTRVNCYINGFTSSSCPEEQILGSGS
ncbi:MAG TPA: hypothetical protein VMU77_07025, partial [Acidimicrobiales bacterium]|nr:hypothetical protein [Acidimicrobiales bacterium]